MTEQNEQIRDATGEAGAADDRRSARDVKACPRVRGLIYFDLLLSGMPLLLVFELIRRLVWFVKKTLPPGVARAANGRTAASKESIRHPGIYHRLRYPFPCGRILHRTAPCVYDMALY